MGLVLLAAIVGIAGVALSDSSHNAACQRYGAALSEATANPGVAPDTSALGALDAGDRATITSSYRHFQKAVVTDPALDRSYLASWSAWATRFHDDSMRAQGCP